MNDKSLSLHRHQDLSQSPHRLTQIDEQQTHVVGSMSTNPHTQGGGGKQTSQESRGWHSRVFATPWSDQNTGQHLNIATGIPSKTCPNSRHHAAQFTKINVTVLPRTPQAHEIRTPAQKDAIAKRNIVGIETQPHGQAMSKTLRSTYAQIFSWKTFLSHCTFLLYLFFFRMLLHSLPRSTRPHGRYWAGGRWSTSAEEDIFLSCQTLLYPKMEDLICSAENDYCHAPQFSSPNTIHHHFHYLISYRASGGEKEKLFSSSVSFVVKIQDSWVHCI